MSIRHAGNLHTPQANRLTTAPSVEPVTLDDLRDHLRISHTDEDDHLERLITEARQEIEDTTGIAFITQSWTATMDEWPPGAEEWWDGTREAHVNSIYKGRRYRTVELGRYPLISVTSCTVYDEDDNSSAVTIATTFDIDTSTLRGRLSLQVGATWPVALRSNKAIEIVYSAGYGATAVNVPAPLKRAVRQMAAYMYEHRGDCGPGDAYVQSGARAIMQRYSDVRL